MQYNKMCLICYVNAYHNKLNVNVDKYNKKAVVSQIQEPKDNSTPQFQCW